MSDERTRRVVHNEALYRQVNERIAELSDAFEPVTGDFAVVCECGELRCTDQISVPRDVYERTRQNSSWFILKPGHDVPDVEHVVEKNGGYIVVEKDPGEAKRLAIDTDPRT